MGCFQPTISEDGYTGENPRKQQANEDTDTGDGIVETGPIRQVQSAVHDEVSTVLVVTWTQTENLEDVSIEFTFENDDWFATPAESLEAGEHSQVLLGTPADTDVTYRFVWGDDEDNVTREYDDSTDDLPFGLPEPEMLVWDESLASTEPWVLISIDSNKNDWYSGPFYVLILDRMARVVWYYPIRGDDTCMYPRVAPSGTHITFEESTTYNWSSDDPRLVRLSLDHGYSDAMLLDDFSYAYYELDDGTILRDGYDNGYNLVEQSPDGTREVIWRCSEWGGSSSCYTNTINYVEEHDSVLWSMPSSDTVVEIERSTGEVLRVFGEGDEGYEIVPEEAHFDFNHFPNYTPDGTLLVSSHWRGDIDEQRAYEYEVDDESGVLWEVWTYGEGVDEYAYYSGEATRLENGNTLINYGTGGAAREVTIDQELVWDIDWGDWYLTGHMTLVDDLYALNEGE